MELPTTTSKNLIEKPFTRENTIVLFDVDDTLTPPRKVIKEEMRKTLESLRKKVTIGFVGGSDLSKQIEQFGPDVLEQFDYSFSENGLVAYKGTTEIGRTSYIDWIGEERHKKLVNFLFKKLAEIDIPVKRGTFIEFRNGMLNVSPIGRACSQKERDEFDKYDKIHHIRENLVKDLKKEFSDYGLTYSIGGQISIDIFPAGWDKTYCLQYIKDKFKNIFFFGDKTSEGGNDYEIFNHELTNGYTVSNPQDTIQICTELFLN